VEVCGKERGWVSKMLWCVIYDICGGLCLVFRDYIKSGCSVWGGGRASIFGGQQALQKCVWRGRLTPSARSRHILGSEICLLLASKILPDWYNTKLVRFLFLYEGPSCF
jgi:hypothetical protein